jgi:quinol monooxygenase YgiN
MEQYGLIGKLKPKPGKSEELEQILIRAAELMKNAKGCSIYLVGHLENAVRDIQIIEVWDSKEDHDASLSYPGVKDLIKEAMPLMDGPPEKGVEIAIAGGHGP